MKLWIMGLVVGLVVAGCTTPGGGVMNTNIPEDAGKEPKSYEQTIKAYLRTALRDPNSMIDFEVDPPALSSCSVGIYGAFHGWRVTTRWNSKNGFGGYTGRQRGFFWFHGESLKGFSEDSTSCPEAPGWRRNF